MSTPQRLAQAIAHHQAGRLAEAQGIYRAILTADPGHADALHLLGVLAHQTGQHGPAEALIARAIARAPEAFAFRNSLGNVLRALGRPEKAEAAYREAIRLQPAVPEFHHHLGLALADQGRNEAAEAAFRHALRLRDDFLPARLDLANLLTGAGRAAAAEEMLRPAPENPLVLNARGLALAAQDRHAAALAEFERALALAPDHRSAMANRAACLASLERYGEAVIAYEAALGSEPGAEDLRLGLARTCLLQGRASLKHGDTEAALQYFRRANGAAPGLAGAWHDTGLALRDLGRWREALAPLAEAARLAPQDPAIRADYGYALLVQEKFAEAWPHFEWRVKKPGNARLREPMWDGAPTDRRVLIHAEQGVGDTLQFCRFVAEAARRAPVLLACQASLHDLLRGLPGVTDIVSGEPVPPYDLHCPIMSLPFVLGVDPAHFSDMVPYLATDPARVACWRDRLASLPSPRVGLVWAGNPKFPADSRRSAPFEALAPLLALPGIGLVSLQKGAAAPPPDTLYDPTARLTDFADTAALVQALDLVISVDTAVAHLAGALGRPVWLLNRADTDWRWLLDRADSPWYPSMRIFRQPAPGDWDSVMRAVAGALRDL